MSHKGAGGRWSGDGDDGVPIEDLNAEPPGLSAVELVSFAATIGFLFWIARELADRGAGNALFQRQAPERHVFVSLALALGAYLTALSGTNVSKMARLAGSMLASVVSVALLYLLLYLGLNLYVTGAGIALAAGASLSSRTGMPRDQAYPAAVIAASMLVLVFAAAGRFMP